jgi:Alpha/beta hydrolase of unknown function (DUF900)
MITCIFFFGGYRASIHDVAKWQGSAADQTSDDVYVFTYAWPAAAPNSDKPANSDDKHAVSSFRSAGTFDKAVSDIKSCGADRIFIVGHSSGCAISKAVDHAVVDKDKVTLVALDGFAPDVDQLARPSTQVWAAERKQGGKLFVSRNHDRLKETLGGRLKIFNALSGTTKWALHFSLVNVAANDYIDEPSKGYRSCRANLVRMKP